jgi:peptidoglycan/LPS O-acetylase OafA/YrhL
MPQVSVKSANQRKHENSLDFLRLIAALGVVLGHLVDIPRYLFPGTSPAYSLINGFSTLGVMTFFVISGYVNHLSLRNDPSPTRFYWKRVVRIAPAYVAIVLLQTAGFILVFPDRVQWSVLPKYLLANLATANFLQPSFVSGIFAINGALWTIKVELLYYLILPLLMPLYRDWRLLVVIALASLFFGAFVPGETLSKQLPGMIYLFILGVVLAKSAGQLDRVLIKLVLPLGTALFLLEHYRVYEVGVGHIPVGAALLAVALVALFARIRRLQVPLDVSYSLYLVHFPLVVLGYAAFHLSFGLPVEALLTSVAMGAAILVTILVERPAMRVGRAWIKKKFPAAAAKILDSVAAPTRP